MTIKGDSIDAVHPLLQQLTWLATSKRYSGNVFLPSAGAKWTAEVRVYDSSNRMIGYQQMAFDKGAATISMPTFNCENAKPIAIAHPAGKPDTTLSIYDTLRLHGAAVDTFDTLGRRANPLSPVITKWEWAVGNIALFNRTGSDTTIILPATQDTNYRCVLRVTDGDGNEGCDTIRIHCKRFAPWVSAGNDTIVSIKDTVRLHGTAFDTIGRIVKYEWNINNTGFATTASGDTVIVARRRQMAIINAFSAPPMMTETLSPTP